MRSAWPSPAGNFHHAAANTDRRATCEPRLVPLPAPGLIGPSVIPADAPGVRSPQADGCGAMDRGDHSTQQAGDTRGWRRTHLAASARAPLREHGETLVPPVRSPRDAAPGPTARRDDVRPTARTGSNGNEQGSRRFRLNVRKNYFADESPREQAPRKGCGVSCGNIQDRPGTLMHNVL